MGQMKSKGVQMYKKNPHLHIIPYYDYTFEGFKSIRYWLFRRGLAMPKPQNVLVPSIFNSINMGYKEIRIYGADHSWTESIRVDDENKVCLTDPHFYDKKKVNMRPWLKCSGEHYLMHEILRDLAWMFESYHVLRDYAEHCGCRIVNCTRNSYIDAFEKLIQREG
jgi:hypothetical protein